MTRAELIELEREVEAARARFAGSLARVRSPAAVQELKADLVEVKDEAVSRARHAAQDTFANFASELKERAAANPAGAFAIGAGLLWHFLHKPPIASLLVGVGAVSLMRTDPQRGPGPIPEALGRAAGYGSERLQTLTEAAKTRTRDTVSGAREAMAQASETARHAVSRASETARQSADRGYEFAADLTRNSEATDNLLLGAAALAIGTAIVISYQKQQYPESDTPLGR